MYYQLISKHHFDKVTFINKYRNKSELLLLELCFKYYKEDHSPPSNCSLFCDNSLAGF